MIIPHLQSLPLYEHSTIIFSIWWPSFIRVVKLNLLNTLRRALYLSVDATLDPGGGNAASKFGEESLEVLFLSDNIKKTDSHVELTQSHQRFFNTFYIQPLWVSRLEIRRFRLLRVCELNPTFLESSKQCKLIK